jgi:RNA polymerase sigma factor (sigma-70 family)
MVFNLALNYTQNIEDAEEITQDAFVAVHDSYEKFEHKASLSTWIYRITINKSLDFLKAKKRKKRFAFITALFFDDGITPKHNAVEQLHPARQLEQKESLQILLNHIHQLPSKQKTVIILHKIQDKPQIEVAEIMQISPKAVGQLMQRAKINLYKNIEKNKK